MVVFLQKNRRTSKSRKPQRLLYRARITNDELSRLIHGVGREQVEAVLRALDLQTEPALTSAE